MSTLFDIEPVCALCYGEKRVWYPRIGAWRPCPKCSQTSDPDKPAKGKHQRPGDAAETQIDSAMRVAPNTGTWRRRVLDAIAAAGERGMTDEEIQNALSMNPSTQRPRRVELVEGKWIHDSGRTRRTRSGSSAVVWTLIPGRTR